MYYDAEDSPQYLSEDELMELASELHEEYVRYNPDLTFEVVLKAVRTAEDGYLDDWGIQSSATALLMDWGLVPPEGEEPEDPS